jgi:hypothetical protein
MVVLIKLLGENVVTNILHNVASTFERPEIPIANISLKSSINITSVTILFLFKYFYTSPLPPRHYF